MKHLIVLSGPIGVGKSSFFEALETFGAERISTRSYILDTTALDKQASIAAAIEIVEQTTAG
jgi:broad-specificity NMP kinase